MIHINSLEARNLYFEEKTSDFCVQKQKRLNFVFGRNKFCVFLLFEAKISENCYLLIFI